MDQWVPVYSGNQFHSIEIIKAALKEQDIESVSIDKRDSSYIGIGEIEVYVPGKDAILARIIIKELEL